VLANADLCGAATALLRARDSSARESIEDFSVIIHHKPRAGHVTLWFSRRQRSVLSVFERALYIPW
jgi:hypothetical protein